MARRLFSIGARPKYTRKFAIVCLGRQPLEKTFNIILVFHVRNEHRYQAVAHELAQKYAFFTLSCSFINKIIFVPTYKHKYVHMYLCICNNISMIFSEYF